MKGRGKERVKEGKRRRGRGSDGERVGGREGEREGEIGETREEEKRQ